MHVQPVGCRSLPLDYEPGQISTWHSPMMRIACAHSVVPFGQTWQTSGTGKFGHGSVTGGGTPQSISQTYESVDESHLQSRAQFGLPAGMAPPHALPGRQEEPGLQVEPWHTVPHWKWPVPSHMQDVEHPELPWITVPQPLPCMQAAPWLQSPLGGGVFTGHGNSSTHS